MGLEIHIRETRAGIYPFRSLELECSVKVDPAGPREIAILSAWIRIGTQDSTNLVDGPYFKQFHAPYGKATFPGSGYGVITVPLTPSVLETIERRRRGDLLISIQSQVLAAPVHEVNIDGKPVSILGATYQTVFSANGTTPILHTIPHSDWIKLLAQMKWSALELFEVPTEEFSSDPDLKRSIELLREAQNRLLGGDWLGVLQNCRQAFEAAAAGIGQTENKKSNFRKLIDRAGGGPKSERLNALVLSLSAFCHLGRHEEFPTVLITREDARAALRCSLSIFALLGGRVD